MRTYTSFIAKSYIIRTGLGGENQKYWRWERRGNSWEGELRGPRSELRGPQSELRGPRSELRGPWN